MDEPPINKAIKLLLSDTLKEIERFLNCDVLTYSGPLEDGIESTFMSIVEEIAQDKDRHDTLAIFLTTNGGSAIAVERYVNILRHHYDKIIFVVPDHAYSAGTIFCMSGDEIWMDYSSVLGPIDPQVPNKEGRYVPALGYIDKVNELIEKAKNNTLTNAEFLLLKDFDLAELRRYEQARDLTIDLLKKWLVKYKFKNWTIHRDGRLVTQDEKEKRAEDIAGDLSNNKTWKSHARPIDIEELEKLKLKIDDYSGDETKRNLIRKYHRLVQDYQHSYKLSIFVHTRLFL